MEGCIETTTVDGNETITVFAKDGAIVAKRYLFAYKLLEVERWYNAEDKRNRESQPAIIHYEDGKITREYWYKDDKLHRDARPAEIYYKDGKITYQSWYKDGKVHRDGQPTVIDYKDGKVVRQCWHKDDKYYREIGPNYIEIYDGIISNYWLDTEGDDIDYLNLPEAQRLSPEFRQAISQTTSANRPRDRASLHGNMAVRRRRLAMVNSESHSFLQ